MSYAIRKICEMKKWGENRAKRNSQAKNKYESRVELAYLKRKNNKLGAVERRLLYDTGIIKKLPSAEKD